MSTWNELTKEQRAGELRDFMALNKESRAALMRSLCGDASRDGRQLLQKLATADLHLRILMDDRTPEERKFQSYYDYPVQGFKLPEYLKEHAGKIEALKKQIEADSIAKISEHLSE